MTRSNLIVVRAGDQSKHPYWLLPQGVKRSWDLFVSYYGEIQGRYENDGEYYQAKPGGCWSGNAAALDYLGHVVGAYDYIAFANDDMYASSVSWDRLFSLCSKHKVDFGHPSVLRNSIASLRPQPFEIRKVKRLPDLNVPVLSARAVAAVRHTFTDSEIGLGCLWVWPHLCPTYSTAIIDSVRFDHTRPLGKGDRVVFEKKTGIKGEVEMQAMLEKYGIQRRKSG